MSKYRIYELAKEFNTTSKVVLDILARNNNNSATNHLSSVGDTEKNLIQQVFSSDRMPKYRIYELAKEFNTTSKVILDILARNNNNSAENHLSSVGDTERDMLQQTFSKKPLNDTINNNSDSHLSKQIQVDYSSALKTIQHIFTKKELNDTTNTISNASLSQQIQIERPSVLKLTSVDIHNFRKFSPSTKIEIHPKLTLIVGQNATSKSTLLGMICQPFEFTAEYKKYTDIYDNIDKKATKTIFGTNFESDFSNVFRMSPINDNPKDNKYTYTINLTSTSKTKSIPLSPLPVSSEYRTDQKINNVRFVTGKTRERGSGNYPHPVIYLGLNRLYPLANSNKLEINADFRLDLKEQQFYTDWQKKITVITENISPEFVSSDTKDFLACRTEYYDAEANSAGQDNLGQIISAVISFSRLKNKLGNNYQGGILLIDEVDASFHVLAQEKLLEFLIFSAEQFSLQIVCTTHSLKMIELCSHQYKRNSSIISLYRRQSNILVKNNASYDDICAELSALKTDKKPTVITVLFEDAVACSFFEHITNKTFGNFIKTYSTQNENDETSVPSDVYLCLATKNIPDFNKLIFVIDGDKASEITTRHKHIIALPGQKSLEEEMYNFLHNLSETDHFWSMDLGGYTYQMCFRNHIVIECDAKTKKYKAWFQAQSKNWGENNKKLYIRWIESHKDIVKTFNENFFKTYNKISNEKLNKDILKSITNWIDNLSNQHSK